METTVTMVKRYAYEKPRRLEKKELTPLQLEFKEKCKKYPVIAVSTEYDYKTPHYIGPPQFITVREVDESNDHLTWASFLDEGNWITVDELDIEPPSGYAPRVLPICEITSYDEDNNCYIWRESVKVKFYQEVTTIDRDRIQINKQN